MAYRRPYLSLDDRALQEQCRLETYRAAGPGGQHRNKTSSAVRLTHLATGLSAQAEDSRSQHENRRIALRRLRRELACARRFPIEAGDASIPPEPVDKQFHITGGSAPRRLEINPRNPAFWSVAACLLDLLESHQGRASQAAGVLGITTSNFIAVLQSERHLLGAAQEIRKRHGCRPLR